MKPHIALVLFCADNQKQKWYIDELFDLRLHSFNQQENIEELTLFISPKKFIDSDYKKLEKIKPLTKNFKKIRVIFAKTSGHPGSGYIYRFIESSSPFTFVSEDGHFLPTSSDSVFSVVKNSLNEMNFDLLYSVSYWGPRIADEQEVSKFGRFGIYKFPILGHNTISNMEWGHFIKSELINSFYRPASYQRSRDMLILAYTQRYVTAYNSLFLRKFVHHSIKPHRCAWSLPRQSKKEVFGTFKPSFKYDQYETLKEENEKLISKLEILEDYVIKK